MTDDAMGRGWVFTLNNPTCALDEKLWKRAYVSYQLEVGENGTPHFQGAVYFASPRKFTQVKKILPTAHWEKMRGTWQEAFDYSQKEDTRYGDVEEISGPWTFGDATIPPIGAAGQRSDLISIKQAIDTGANERTIAQDHFETWIRHYRGLAHYRSLVISHRDWHTTAIVYWGPPGTGKSRHALEMGGESQYWLSQPKHSGADVWWDGYDGQEVVVIDEMGGWLPRTLVQRLVDRYPMQVETKGGSKPFLSRQIIFTSNKPPSMWWPRVGLGPMERRLAEPLGFVYWFGPGGVPNQLAEDDYLYQLQVEANANAQLPVGAGPAMH